MHGVQAGPNQMRARGDHRDPRGGWAGWKQRAGEGGPHHAEQIEAEREHQHAADAADPGLVLKQEAAERGRRGAEREEDQGESGDEPERVHERRAALHLQIFGGETGEEPDVARDERQDAGREKAEQPGRERDRKGDVPLVHGVSRRSRRRRRR
jgi:hypothetical protein